MPVIGLTRVLPQVLSETRALLAAAWSQPADTTDPEPAGEG
jgi:ATP adenylyltransferase